MYNNTTFEKSLSSIIKKALKEDIGDGDHSSLACIPSDAKGSAHLIAKEEGIVAGVDFALKVFEVVDSDLSLETLHKDGSEVKKDGIILKIYGKQQSILKAERLVLNGMQRMSGIATMTNDYVSLIKGTKAKVLDTRKTTPNLRVLEKWAVRIGGGINHRFGLYDMIILKDNHIDFAGGIFEAIKKTKSYLKTHQKHLKIIVEARNLKEVESILECGGVDRILLDNFNIAQTKQAVNLINGRFQTESSGSITINTIGKYADCGVDYISSGALTHSIKSLDISLKVF